jgi:catechol 2,3-dioxygenase-like lactoylglutathione lyase family enzyme
VPSVNLVLLYVENPQASAAFYADLLGGKPSELSPTFSTLPLCDGMTLGLWARRAVEPAAAATGNAGELSCDVADVDALRHTHDDWRERGVSIAQPPTRKDFGDTFVALDPDGHRIRVVAPLAP